MKGKEKQKEPNTQWFPQAHMPYIVQLVFIAPFTAQFPQGLQYYFQSHRSHPMVDPLQSAPSLRRSDCSPSERSPGAVIHN